MEDDAKQAAKAASAEVFRAVVQHMVAQLEKAADVEPEALLLILSIEEAAKMAEQEQYERTYVAARQAKLN
jgi:hypothetical protein